MRQPFAFLAAAIVAGCASAQVAQLPVQSRAYEQTVSRPASELEKKAATGVPVVVPENERGGAIVVMPGVAMTVALDSKLRIAALMSGHAPASLPVVPPELDPKDETLRSVGSTRTIEVPSDQLQFTLWSDPSNGSVLMVKNGEKKKLIYIAALVHGEPKQENYKLTTTCSVAAGSISFEGWHERIDGIAILKVLEPPPSDGVICVDPTENPNKLRWYSLDE